MRRLDHSAIFLLIAGSYTPFALLALDGTLADVILVVVWAGAIGGIVLKLVWIDAPKWLVALIYVALGWVAVAATPDLVDAVGLTAAAMVGLGGLLYTVGAVVYARRRPDPVPAVFGYHEVFHLLVIVAAGASVRGDRLLGPAWRLESAGNERPRRAVGVPRRGRSGAGAHAGRRQARSPRRGDRPAARARACTTSPRPASAGWRSSPACSPPALIFLPWNDETRGILAGAAAIALIGAVDDAKEGGLSPLVKLAGQLAAAAIPVFADVRVENITLPFVDPLDLGDWGIPLTLLGLVAVMNVVNFTDGVDGLAAGRVHDRGDHLRGDRPLARPRRRRGARRGGGGRVRGLPAPQLPPGLDLHGRLRLQPARPAAGRAWRSRAC